MNEDHVMDLTLIVLTSTTLIEKYSSLHQIEKEIALTLTGKLGYNELGC